MKFKESTQLIFEKVPEFKSYYKDELNEEYYNSFLGDFGLFTRDSIVNGKPYAIKCLKLISFIFNKYYDDIDFRNKIIVNILEVLTDYPITQKATVDNFNHKSLTTFKKMLEDSFLNLLNQPNNDTE